MSFNYYRSITVNGGQVPSAQSNFPMLISVTLDASHVLNSSGYDIRPYADAVASSALTYELETYNNSTGVLVMWVKVASINTGSVVYLFYGDAALTTNGSSASTWDSHYKGVWHLPDGSSLTANDSTSGGIGNGTITAATATAGKIDGGASFNGSTTQIDFGTPTINYAAATFSMWFHEAAVDHGGTSFTQWQDSPDSSDCFILDSLSEAYTASTGHGRFVLVTDGVHHEFIVGNTAIDDGNWHYVVGVFTGSQLLIYVDGASDATAVNSLGSTLNSSALHMYFGRYTNSAFFKGLLDEMRISNTNRSADWITTEYNNQSVPSSFYTVGAETALTNVWTTFSL